MRYFLSFILLLYIPFVDIQCQDKKQTLYSPEADAVKELEATIFKANSENKHVLVQVGGNWCKWCLKIHEFVQQHQELDSIINTDYVFMRVNYSKENKNLETLKKLEYPQRFGFPVFVVLDADGKRLHTQDTGFLEEGDGYSLKKFKTFLLAWKKEALNPENYK